METIHTRPNEIAGNAVAVAPPVSLELPVERLRTRCRAEDLGLVTTADITELPGASLQQRALSALQMGVRIASPTHNVYVMGEPGSGRHAFVQEALRRDAGSGRVPDDWCYVNRFDDPQRPRALRLPHGRGSVFKADMRELVRDIGAALPEALESEVHRNRRAEATRAFEQRIRESIEAIQAQASRLGVALIEAPDGFAVAPIRDGEVVSPEQFAKLSEPDRAAAREHMDAISELLRKHFEELPQWHRDHHRRLRELERETTQRTVHAHIAGIRARYQDCPEVLDHLSAVEADLVDTAGSALQAEPPAALVALGLTTSGPSALRSRYDVNVVIDGRGAVATPIVYEGNPTYQNLIGQIDTVVHLGALTTDFMLVRPGALHRANGGFLILDAERLLTQPFAWEALKHALFERSVRIESLGERLSLISTLSLEPDRIPLQVRVILIGSRHLYSLLSLIDPEFAELFKLAADFDDDIERSPANVRLYLQLVAASIRREQLKPLDAAAAARLLEYSSRLAGDSRKLSTHWRSIEDCLREASYCAAAGGREVVAVGDVDQALRAQVQRLGRIHEQTLDSIRTHVRLIDCEGQAVGQVNALSVVPVGPMLFGQPSRITATVRIGEGEVLDIEREVKLGGAIHSKGVLILSSLIGSRFGERTPLSLHASIAFEQSYAGVEGDSASLAEACALLSAIAEVPLTQSLGLTGSVNQHGIVQAIGGVNEKIEGFYEACSVRGLTGSQGVIIPLDNVPHLMLREDIVEAVAAHRFKVLAVGTLDQALQLLTGLPIGERGPQGAFPPDSFNARVERRLQAFAEARRAVARGSSPGRRESATDPGG